MTENKISFVIPVYNEQENVAELHRRICAAMEREPYGFEIVFVDDGSTDDTFEKIEEVHKSDARVVCLSFSRNFGREAALVAGMDACGGDAVIMMDGDLQHDPELAPAMIRQWESGYEVVSMVRERTVGAGFFKSFTSSMFYFIINRIGNIEIERNATDFRLLDSSVVRSLRNVRERTRFTRGLVGWIGFRKVSIPYTAEPRYAGEAKYNARKMIGLALDAVVSFSTFPLRISTFLGLFAILFGFGYFVFGMYSKIKGVAVPGWTSLMVIMTVMGGTQLVGLGLMGEYMARIYEETKKRPLYIVRRELRGGKRVNGG